MYLKLLLGTIHTRKFPLKRWYSIYRRIYPNCLSDKIWIDRVNNDPKVVGVVSMQANKITTIQVENRSFLHYCPIENFEIRSRYSREFAFLDRNYIMLQPTQFLNYCERKIFVGVKPSQSHSPSFSLISCSISA